MKIPENESELEEYLETHYEIVASFYNHQESEVLNEIENNKGRGGMWEYAKQLTDEFLALHEGVVWGEELEWFDELENFLKNKI